VLVIISPVTGPVPYRISVVGAVADLHRRVHCRHGRQHPPRALGSLTATGLRHARGTDRTVCTVGSGRTHFRVAPASRP
jgi:hypothetical protein